MKEESEKYFTSYKEYAENNQSIYRHMNLAAYYSYLGETDKAIEHLELFSEEDNYFYWILVFPDIDPMIDNIRGLPEYKRIMKKIDKKFWDLVWIAQNAITEPSKPPSGVGGIGSAQNVNMYLGTKKLTNK